jgi:hypothetical protein
MPKPSNYIRTLENKRWLIKCEQCHSEYDIYPDHKRKTVVCQQCTLKNRNTTHGESTTRLYKIWTDMKKRCDNPNHKMFKYYGEAGITYQYSWVKFEHFRDWAINNGYTNELEIDRKDNSVGYSEDNCRWTTRSIQMQNTRRINSTNKSGYRGVNWNKARKRWIAQISVNNKKIHIGHFDTALEAGKAYDNYVKSNNLEHTTNGV